MEVKEHSTKYLVSQVGRDLHEWQAIKLGTAASFRTGPFGSALHKSDYVFGGVPIVNPMQIEEGRIKPTERMSITEEAAARLSEFRLQSGDVVIGRRGEMGRCAFVEDSQVGWLCGTGSMIVRPGSRLDGRFVQRVLSSNQAVRAIESASVGTTMINLNQKALAELDLHIPINVDEQSSIANALADADALIDSLEQLLTKKRHIKQGTMQELLTGKRRLPGFEQPWVPYRLGDISTITMGRTPARLVGNYWGVGHKWLSIADLKGKVIADSKEEITDAGAQGTEEIPEGTLLMSFKLTIGRLAFAGCKLYTNEAICALRNPKVDKELLYYALSRVDFSLFGKQAVKGYTLNKESLRNVEVLLPTDPEEQRAIAKGLAEVDAGIAILESLLTKARALKQAMSQALLTGRIRLMESNA